MMKKLSKTHTHTPGKQRKELWPSLWRAPGNLVLPSQHDWCHIAFLQLWVQSPPGSHARTESSPLGCLWEMLWEGNVSSLGGQKCSESFEIQRTEFLPHSHPVNQNRRNKIQDTDKDCVIRKVTSSQIMWITNGNKKNTEFYSLPTYVILISWFQIRQPGVSSGLIYELTWSLCSATSSAKPLLGVGITFASVAFFGSGSCVYKWTGVKITHCSKSLLFLLLLYTFRAVPHETCQVQVHS